MPSLVRVGVKWHSYFVPLLLRNITFNKNTTVNSCTTSSNLTKGLVPWNNIILFLLLFSLVGDSFLSKLLIRHLVFNKYGSPLLVVFLTFKGNLELPIDFNIWFSINSFALEQLTISEINHCSIRCIIWLLLICKNAVLDLGITFDPQILAPENDLSFNSTAD